jgi:basic membrane protein A
MLASRAVWAYRRRSVVRAATAALVVSVLVGMTATSDAATPLKVAFVTDVPTTPGSRDLRGLAHQGFVQAVRDFGVRGRVVVVNPKLGVDGTLASLGRERFDLVFTGLATISTERYAQAVGKVAGDYPDTAFVMHDLPYEILATPRPPNVQGTVWHVEQPAYLAGYLAALLERGSAGRDAVGSVGGYPLPGINAFIAGFEAGARRASRDVATLHGYAFDFFDRGKCRAVAKSQIARGAGAVFNVAGTCGLGALEAARAAHVWGIGVDVDQAFLGSHILTSVLKRWDFEVYATVRALVRGTLRTGGNSEWTLRNGGVGIAPINKAVPRAVVAQVNALRADIRTGRVTAPASFR